MLNDIVFYAIAVNKGIEVTLDDNTYKDLCRYLKSWNEVESSGVKGLIDYAINLGLETIKMDSFMYYGKQYY